MEQIKEFTQLVWNQEIVLFDAVLTAFVLCRVGDIDVENQYLQLDRIRQLNIEELPVAVAQLASEPLAQTVLLNERPHLASWQFKCRFLRRTGY